MAARSIVNLIINQKASFRVKLNVQSSGGTPVDLSGYTVLSKYKTEVGASDASAKPFSTVITNAATGEITLSLTAAETAQLTLPRYVYDLVITETSTGYRTRIAEGKITVSAGVTPVTH
jgi:hypothetical protein